MNVNAFSSQARDATSDASVAELGEAEVLRRVLRSHRAAAATVVGPGDDTAVMRVRGRLAVTSDTMIEGEDFVLKWHRNPPVRVSGSGWSFEAQGMGDGVLLGFKLAATNLSDIAAMGAEPIGLTIAVACPGATSVRLLEGIMQGVSLACEMLAPQCGVVGGDLATAPVLILAATALGDLDGASPVTRDGAKPGDVVAYAGDLGLSGVGFSLLTEATADSPHVHEGSLSPAQAIDSAIAQLAHTHPSAIGAHFAPRSPVHLAAVARRAGATAMLDVSDGLAIDASRLSRASRVAVYLESALLEQHFGEQHGQAVSLQNMLTGGEDHGLLATFAPAEPLPEGFVAIGTVRERAHEQAAQAQVFVDGESVHLGGWDSLSH